MAKKTYSNVWYGFEKMLGEIMLDSVNAKLELYKMLSDAEIKAVAEDR